MSPDQAGAIRSRFAPSPVIRWTTISGGSFNGYDTIRINRDGNSDEVSEGKLIINGSPVITGSHNTIYMNGAELEVSGTPTITNTDGEYGRAIYVNHGSATISGGTISGPGTAVYISTTASISVDAIITSTNGNAIEVSGGVTITGGTITGGANSVNATGNSVEITGGKFKGKLVEPSERKADPAAQDDEPEDHLGSFEV